MDRVQIFDTTLRDGEQSPGATMNVEEKLRDRAPARAAGRRRDRGRLRGLVARATSRPCAASPRPSRSPIVLSLARTREQDIDRALAAVEKAKRPGIHIFIATSDIHLKHKLMMSRQEVRRRGRCGPSTRAKKHVDYVEFSAEDASRSDRLPGRGVRRGDRAPARRADQRARHDRLRAAARSTARSSARSRERVPGGDEVVWSAHCHNDLGMAVANSLAAVAERRAADRVHRQRHRRARRQHGDGRGRDGASRRARDLFGVDTGIVTEQIYPTSRLVSQITGHRRSRSTSRSSATTRSRTRPASIRTACSSTGRTTRS